MSALDIVWKVKESANRVVYETKVGQQCVVIVEQWSFGEIGWRVSVVDDRAARMLTFSGKAPTVNEAMEAALASVEGTFAALKRAIGPDLAKEIRQAQASVDAAQAAYDQGEWAEPETIARSSLAQLRALVTP